MGRGDDAHIERYGLGGADGSHLFFLQYPQQLALQHERHVADLVQEDCAAHCRLEQSFVVADRPGECAFDMAKQLGFEQLLGNGRAIDRHERPLRPRAGIVYRMGKKFLAGSALSADQDARISFGHQLGLGQDVFHHRTLGDDGGAPLVRLSGLRCCRERNLERLRDLVQQHLAVERLGQIAEQSALRGVDRIGNGAVCRQHDDRQGRDAPVDMLEQGHAIHALHAHIRDHEVRPGNVQAVDGGLGAICRIHLETGRCQPHGQQLQQVRIVVNDQYPARRRHRLLYCTHGWSRCIRLISRSLTASIFF